MVDSETGYVEAGISQFVFKKYLDSKRNILYNKIIRKEFKYGRGSYIKNKQGLLRSN